jgi:DNA repair exonuclease SbcCD ATPase subunit
MLTDDTLAQRIAELSDKTARVVALEEVVTSIEAKLADATAAIESNQALQVAATQRASDADATATENAAIVVALQDSMAVQHAAFEAATAELVAEKEKRAQDFAEVVATLAAEKSNAEAIQATLKQLESEKRELSDELKNVNADREFTHTRNEPACPVASSSSAVHPHHPMFY